MSPSLATLIYALGIAGLFYLNRDDTVKTSRALWIPVIWFWILGSRAVSLWLGGGAAAPSADVMMDGSPIDALVFQLLIASGLTVLARRGHRASSLIAANWPIAWYFSYCLVSALWSDYPDVSIKRWVKATGDVIMALVVVTDAQPLAALRRLFSRIGFVLLPSSVLLYKYYPYLGRKFESWTGAQSFTGVTTDKNLLGAVAYILALGALWQVLRLLRESRLPNRTRQLTAQWILLALGVWILFTANSATSESCFMLGTVLMLVTHVPLIRRRPAAVHATVLTILLLLGLAELTGAHAVMAGALGRKADLTGRASEIWPLLIPMVPNALLGAGFETFWLGPRLQEVWAALPNLYVTEAHNGYIELYLNLGGIGVILIVLVLVHGYRRSVATFRIDPNAASMMLACSLTAVMYSYTEAGFRMLFFPWSFLILAILAASRILNLANEDAGLARDPSQSVWWSTVDAGVVGAGTVEPLTGMEIFAPLERHDLTTSSSAASVPQNSRN